MLYGVYDKAQRSRGRTKKNGLLVGVGILMSTASVKSRIEIIVTIVVDIRA